MRFRSDGAVVPRHRNGADNQSPIRAADQPPRVMPRPCSPHKIAVSRCQTDSLEKRRLTTFHAGSISLPDRKFGNSHVQRSSAGSVRHTSLGDPKALEAEALAEVSVGTSNYKSRKRYLQFGRPLVYFCWKDKSYELIYNVPNFKGHHLTFLC